jgi:ATP-dependent DNA helicase Q4
MILLKSSPFVDMRSIIVYCKFQVEFFCFLKMVYTVQYLNPLDTILLQKYNIICLQQGETDYVSKYLCDNNISSKVGIHP